RVGFLSAHFRWHSVGRLTVALLEELSSSSRELKVFVVDASIERRSSLVQQPGPAVRDTFHGDSVESAGNRALHAARETIAALKLDVLVYGDVGMDAFTTALAHSRLSPVQVAFWGHPGTTGLPTMDYFLTSDSFEPKARKDKGDSRARTCRDDYTSVDEPEACAWGNVNNRQDAYAEQLVRLGGLGFLFDDPIRTFRGGGRLEHAPRLSPGGFAGAASPETVKGETVVDVNRPRLYICAQSLMKMHPAFDAVLVGILAADPLAQVVLLRDSRQLLWHSRFRRRLREAPGQFWSRVRFVSPLSGRDFFRLQCRADVVLDPFPFGGGVTTLEALACGTPVVTAGALQSVHHLAEGMIAAVAETNDMLVLSLVAETASEYVAKAVAVAAPGELKERVRRALRCGRDGLLQGGGGDVAMDWESFLTRAAASANTDAYV
ncbi:unnamed protein product, partial [Hapterophycus canaliculatus]